MKFSGKEKFSRIRKIPLFLYFASIIFLTANFSSCANSKLPVAALEILNSEGRTVTVKAEIARTESERNFGFMERKNIPDGTGMIFVFERDQILHFWMKDTLSPLSIAYIDRDGKIRDIFDMTPFSLASVSSTVSVRYALEVPQGWFEKENISEGDRITNLREIIP